LTGHQPRLIIKSNTEFRRRFQELKEGDVVACMLNLAPGEEYVLLDLVDRGVIVFPSALSQLASRSKCCQATIFSNWMHPLTRVIRKRTDLARAVEDYTRREVGEVVTKLDRSDCGLGVCKWKNSEDLFNHIVFSNSPPFPFVLQPLIPSCIDLRIVWIGDEYVEAYWRKNPRGFRNNLHFGGESGRYDMDAHEEKICKAIMKRGKFPYGHIDLLKTDSGQIYFSEISLFGGLKGARIGNKESMDRKQAVEDDFLRNLGLSALG